MTPEDRTNVARLVVAAAMAVRERDDESEYEILEPMASDLERSFDEANGGASMPLHTYWGPGDAAHAMERHLFGTET